MPLGKPHSSEVHGGHGRFREAVRFVLFSAVLGAQSGCTVCVDPDKNWDNTDYLYEDMKKEPVLPPPPSRPEENKTKGVDLLYDTNCTEEICKYG